MNRKKFRIWGGLLSAQALALAALATPMLAGNPTNYTYLALGDSIAFGYSPLVPLSPLPSPSEYTGYPEVVAEFEHLLQSKKEVNAACPGETSGSFISGAPPDNGCYGTGPQGQPGFKDSVGLHTNYTGAQLAFAVSQLAGNKHINLVTLGIGGNDLLLVDQECTAAPSFAACVQAALPTVLEQYAGNLAYILAAIRANYDGTLVLVNNYSPSADPLFIEAITLLDGVMKTVGTNFDVKFADAFTSFQLASAPEHGDPCAAGLLIRLNATTCDVHPSLAGRNLLAATVVLATFGK
jgi:lysophospholipase L1-like esterase